MQEYILPEEDQEEIPAPDSNPLSALPEKQNTRYTTDPLGGTKKWAYGLAETVATVGTGFGGLAAAGIAGISSILNKGVNQLLGTNLPDNVFDTIEQVKQSFPVYSPKTNEGKETLKTVGELAERADLFVTDLSENIIEGVTNTTQDAIELATGVRPSRNETVDNINKAALYTGINLVGLKELGAISKAGLKVASSVGEKLNIPKDVLEMANVYSDIFSTLGPKNAKVRIGLDDREAHPVVLDSMDIVPEFQLTEEGLNQSRHLPDLGTDQNALRDLYYNTSFAGESPLVTVKERYIPKYKDIDNKDEGSIRGGWQAAKEVVTPPYFLQTKNPIIKRLFDWSRSLKSSIDHEVEDVLFGTKLSEGYVKTGKWSERQIGMSTLAGSRTVPSEAGALFEWRDLGEKQQGQLIRTLANLSDDKISKGQAIQYLLHAKELTDPQKQAGIKIINHFESELNKYNIAAEAAGTKGIDPLSSFYLPRYASGKWMLKLDTTKPGGEKVKVLRKGFDTEAEANRFLKDNFDVTKMRKGTDYKIDKTNLGQFDNEIVAFSQLQRYAKETETDSTSVNAFLDSVAKNRSFIEARKARRSAWADGYNYDPKYVKNDKELIRKFEESILFSTKGLIRARKKLAADPEFNAIVSDPGVAALYPNSIRLGTEFRDKVFGKRTPYLEGTEKVYEAFATAIDYASRGYVSPSKLKEHLNTYTNAITTLSLLAWRPPYLIANAIAPYQVGSMYGSMLNSRGLENNITKSMIQAESDLHIKASPEIRDVLNYYTKDSRITRPGFFQQFTFSDEVGLSLHKQSKTSSTVEYLSGKKAALKIDEYTRAKTGLIVYHQLRDAGVSHEDAKMASAQASNHMMVDYSRAEKAGIYDSTFTGVLGKFNSWGHNAVAANLQYIKEVRRSLDNIKTPEGKRNLEKLLAVKSFETTAIGLKAGFGVVYMDKLLNSVGADYNLTEWMQDNLPDWMVYGVPQSATGSIAPSIGNPDVLGPSMAVPNFTVNVIKGVKGVANDYVSYGEYWIKKGFGTVDPNLLPSKAELATFYKSIAPKTAHGAIDAWLAKPDFFDKAFWDLDSNTLYPLHSTKHGGKVLSEVTNKDLLKRILGFISIEEQEQLVNMMRINRLEEKAVNETQHLVNRIAASVEAGIEIPSYLAEKAADLRINSKTLSKLVDKEVESHIISALFRSLDSKNLSPRTIRMLEELAKSDPSIVKTLQDRAGRLYFPSKESNLSHKVQDAVENINSMDKYVLPEE